MNLFFPLTCIITFMWGSAYVLPRFFTHISPILIQLLNGIFVTCFATLYFICFYGTSVGIEWNKLSWNVVGWISLYSFFSCTASVLYFYVSQLPNTSLSILTAITSCYFLITSLWLMLLYQDYKNFILSRFISSLLLVSSGVILFAFSKNNLS